MQSFHEVTFYTIWGFCLLMCIIGDFGLYRGLLNGQLKKDLKESSQELGMATDSLNQLIGEKKTRLINAILASIPTIIVVILIFAMYYQGKAFNSDFLNRTTLAYLAIEILDGIFIAVKWPNPLFPDRPMTKALLATTIFFSVANFLLLAMIFIQTL